MDHRGRKFTIPERQAYWRMALELWQSSSLSVAAFCRREKLCSKSFRLWRKRLSSQVTAGTPRVRAASEALPAGAGFQRIGIVPDSAVAYGSSAPAASGGLRGSVSESGCQLEIILSDRRRLVLHGDVFSPVRLRNVSPDGTVLAHVIRIVEGLPPESAPADDGRQAGGSDAWESRRC